MFSKLFLFMPEKRLENKKNAPDGARLNGAAGENRTHDPTLTKGVLYH